MIATIYQAYPQEFTHLFNTIEINFTSFFRDAEAWDYIATQIVPQIIAGKSESEPIVLAEALGVEQYLSRVKILATDVDWDALKQARRASYPLDWRAFQPSCCRSTSSNSAGAMSFALTYAAPRSFPDII